MYFLVAITLSHVLCVGADKENTSQPPNVLVILADDLGYSDIGCYGGEIRTPVLDELASSGSRFTSFYNTGRCWPTRASLLTGYYAQQVGRDRLPGRKYGGAGARRPSWAKLLPNLIKPFRYRAYHSGKWHIDGTPLAGGFDHSYWTPDHGRFFSPKRHFKDDVQLPAVERGTNYYATTAIADHAIGFLQDHVENHSDLPFFSYVAFIAPHFPLQAPPDDIAVYQNRYDAGWEAIRDQRWRRIREMGLVNGELSTPEPDIGPPYHFPNALKILGSAEVNRPVAWSQLTKEQKDFQSAKMSIHAAMVHRMDIEIGRIVTKLKRIGVLENTLILFLSDNGASAEIMVRDDGHDPNAKPGSADTHLCLGPGWSTVCNTPYRRHKTWVHEGGIATPLIVHWPRRLAIKPGTIFREPCHVIDIVPTILEMVSVKQSETKGAPQVPGQSLIPRITGKRQTDPDATYWWLHEGNRAIRRGNWKLVGARNQPWELYDLSVDPCETHDLSKQEIDRAGRLEKLWQNHVNEFVMQQDRDSQVEGK